MGSPWLKLAGGFLVILASSGLGICLARQWNEHLRTMEQLRKMIFLLKGEIVYANAPLDEAFGRTGRKSGGCLGELFVRVAGRMEAQTGELFYEIWKEETDRIPKASGLSQEEREHLKGFGEHLGYLDLAMQERTILLYLEQLDASILYLREHKREKSRLYTSLGIMGGIFLTIILY